MSSATAFLVIILKPIPTRKTGQRKYFVDKDLLLIEKCLCPVANRVDI
jgi:hypothetical protein